MILSLVCVWDLLRVLGGVKKEALAVSGRHLIDSQ